MNAVLTFFTRQRVLAQEIPYKNLKKESWILMGYSIFYFTLAIGIGKLIQHFPLPILGAKDFIQDVWYAVIFKFTFLLIVPSVLLFQIWKYKIQDLLLGLSTNTGMLIKGALLVAFGFFLNTRHIPRIAEAYTNFEDAEIRLVVGILLPLLIAGLPEELFFRGMLQTRLEKLWNAPLAILVSSLLFTAWHLPSRFFLANGVEGQAGDLVSVLMGTGLPVFVISCFFSWNWTRYRNLPLLILVHWAIDTLPSLSSFFGVSN